MAALDAAWEAQRCAKAKDFFTLDDYDRAPLAIGIREVRLEATAERSRTSSMCARRTMSQSSC